MSIQTVVAVILEYVPVALAIVGGFALLAAKTPNKTDDRVLQVILDIINFLGANLGRAKNEDK